MEGGESMNQIIPKGLDELLNDDPSLQEKVTYEDYLAEKRVPDKSDYSIEEGYEEYKAVMEGKKCI